jgi:glycosyltransferase involved in cell wall biosynthesis
VNILILFTSNEIGGAERSLTRMALANTSKDISYHLATIGGEGAWSNWARALGAAPIALGKTEKSFFRSIPHMLRLWRNMRPDIIYVMGLRAAIVVRLLRIFMPATRIVHGIRANLELTNRFGKQHQIFERMLKYLTDHYITNAHITKSQLSVLAHILPTKIDAIHNGIEVQDALPIAMADRSLEIICVANLAPRKGQIEFLDVVQQLRQTIPSLKVRFLGRDDMEGAVAKRVKELNLEGMVILEGYVAAPETWVSKARITVLPSLWGEGCPTSVLEALALGTPVVAYAIDGLPELIEHGKDGLLAKPGSGEALRDHIITLLSDTNLSQIYGTYGREKIISHFSIQQCAQAHEAIWKKLVGWQHNAYKISAK